MTDSPKKNSRGEKMIIFLYEQGKQGKKHVRYEDMVVGLFKKYPTDFHLKGYPEFPDSGDGMHQPLYLFKKKGYLNASNKIFSLTDRGVEYAKQLTGKSVSIKTGDRLSRTASTEVIRVKSLEGLVLFAKGSGSELTENDFYNYMGVTVRTPKNAFIGRLETMNAVIAELKGHPKDRLYIGISKYHEFITTKYGDIIGFFTKN